MTSAVGLRAPRVDVVMAVVTPPCSTRFCLGSHGDSVAGDPSPSVLLVCNNMSARLTCTAGLPNSDVAQR